MDNKRIIGQKDLENEITKLEATLKNKKEQLEKLRLVNENGKYVLISTGGINELNVEGLPNTWKKAIKQNNVFKTRKDAEKERDRRALLYEFNQFRDECNNGWEPDWKTQDPKHYLYYSGVTEKISFDSITFYSDLSIFSYFKNGQDAQRAIELFGDRIKKLYID